MDDKTIEMLKTHAMYLLGLDLKIFNISDIEGITKAIQTPFMNYKSKLFQKELKNYIKEMSSSHIYDYVNAFSVHQYLFKYHKKQLLIIIGPFLTQRPSEQQCHAMLQNAGVKISNLNTLKQYLLNIPIANQRDALKMTHLSVRFMKDRNVNYKVTPFTLKLHTNELGYAKAQDQYDFTLKDLQNRYDTQNQFFTAIENGEVERAVDLFTQLIASLSGMQRANKFLDNEKYKAYILNTMGRMAIERAGVNLFTVDQLSAENAADIEEAVDLEALRSLMQSMVVKYAESARKAKQYAHTPKVNKVLQYIDMNLDKDFTLNDLAAYADVSASYLSRVFSKEVGMTLSQYVTRKRVKVGRDLLLRTNMTIAEIATYVGFKKQSYFAQKFKAYFKVPPLQYKKLSKMKAGRQ